MENIFVMGSRLNNLDKVIQIYAKRLSIQFQRDSFSSISLTISLFELDCLLFHHSFNFDIMPYWIKAQKNYFH